MGCVSYSRGPSQPRDETATLVSPALAGRSFTTAPPGKPLLVSRADITNCPKLRDSKQQMFIVSQFRTIDREVSVNRVLFSLKTIGEKLFLPLHSFWWFASDLECSLACSREHFCCCLCFMSSHDTLLSHLFLLLFLKRHQSYWFQVHLNPLWSSLSLILSVKILFPSKVMFTGTRG